MTNLTHTDRERIATAYHEAGHAAVAVWCGLQLERVELTPDHPLHSGCCQEKVDDPHALARALERGAEGVIRPQIQVLMAGRAAQEKSGFDQVPAGDSHDSEMALKIATRMVSSESAAEELLVQLLAETRKVLDVATVWAGVEALADELLLKGGVGGDEAHRILSEIPNGAGTNDPSERIPGRTGAQPGTGLPAADQPV